MSPHVPARCGPRAIMAAGAARNRNVRALSECVWYWNARGEGGQPPSPRAPRLRSNLPPPMVGTDRGGGGMAELMVDYITSLDGFGSAEGWPGLWGMGGPEYYELLGVDAGQE